MLILGASSTVSVAVLTTVVAMTVWLLMTPVTVLTKIPVDGAVTATSTVQLPAAGIVKPLKGSTV